MRIGIGYAPAPGYGAQDGVSEHTRLIETNCVKSKKNAESSDFYTIEVMCTYNNEGYIHSFYKASVYYFGNHTQFAIKNGVCFVCVF